MAQVTDSRTAETAAAGRALSSARSVLRVQALLVERPDGVRADDVAEEIGKSVSTAYNVLASLREEGVAVHAAGLWRLAPAFRDRVVAAAWRAHAREALAGHLEETFARTHKRAYAAVVEDGRLRVTGTRGLQGMPVLEGVGPEIRESAHALAIGKVALALTPEMRLQRLLTRGLRAYTGRTVTDPDALLGQLAEVRAGGVAVDEREFDDAFCCLATPLFDERRRLLGIVGIAMSPRAFDAEHDALAAALRAVAGRAAGPAFQPCDEPHAVLEAPTRPSVASGSQVSVPVDRRARPHADRAPARPAGPRGAEQRRHGT
jgi:acetyl-CoA synthetase